MGEILEKGIARLRPLDKAGRRIRTDEDDEDIGSLVREEEQFGTAPYGSGHAFEEDVILPPGSLSEEANLRRRSIKVEEEYDEDEETKENLKAYVGSLALKYFGNTNATAGMMKEFDEILGQIFQAHGGSENLTNLRTPGAYPAKIPASPGQSGKNRTGSYRTEDDPENPNPTEVGSGFVHGNAQERYGSIPAGQGPKSKPRGNYSIPSDLGQDSRAMGQRVPSHPPTASDVPLGTYETSTYLESVQLPQGLAPMKKQAEIEKAETRAMILSLEKAMFDQTEEDEVGQGLETYDYGQRQPTRNEEEAFARRQEEDEKKERFRELEAEASRYDSLAARPKIDEREREEYRNTAMKLRMQASDILKGATVENYRVETTRKMALEGQPIGYNPLEFARKTKVAGSRGSVVK